jgi:hypothetical protein
MYKRKLEFFTDYLGGKMVKHKFKEGEIWKFADVVNELLEIVDAKKKKK